MVLCSFTSLIALGFVSRSEFRLCSKYGMARFVISDGEYGLCHVIFFSSFAVGFGFEHVASMYASSRSSLFFISLKVVSSFGAYATIRIGNLFESSECFGRSFIWSADLSIPFCLSKVHFARPFHYASLPAGIVMTLCI